MLVAVLFALLQSVAPLAHAHVGGDHSARHLHLHEIQQQLDDASQLTNTRAEAADSRAIGVSKAKQRNSVHAAFNHPMVPGHYALLPKNPVAAVSLAAPSRQPPQPLLLFRKQHPQAPPALG
jgi:hypothetical protein